MNSAHQAGNPMRNPLDRPTSSMIVAALTGMLIGATPGAILVLLAQFVIEGEMQLTIGAPGMLLAVAGGVAGIIVATLRHKRHRSI